jgi:CRP-like cAMP-binding protein
VLTGHPSGPSVEAHITQRISSVRPSIAAVDVVFRRSRYFPGGLVMESTHKGTFSAQAFLDSAGIARRIAEYRRADVIFTQGDPCTSVLYIQKGGVKLSVRSKTGREAVVAMVGPDEFFGEGCLAGQPVRMGNATAITGSTILLVDKDEMVRVLHKQPALSDRFIAHMLLRYIRIEEDLLDQLFNSSEKRLARTLLPLAVRQAGHTAEGRPGDLAGDARTNGRHDAVAGEFLHEEVPATGVHRLQGWAQDQQLAAHCRFTELAKQERLVKKTAPRCRAKLESNCSHGHMRSVRSGVRRKTCELPGSNQ